MLQKVKFFALSLVILLFFSACNFFGKEEMNEFLSGKIEIINKTEDGFTLILSNKKESGVYCMLYKKYIDNLSEVSKRIKKGSSISVKGTLSYVPIKKQEKNVTDFFEKTDDAKVIVVKQIKFLDNKN